MTWCFLLCRFEVLMQANLLSSEFDEISDMHKKVLRVSAHLFFTRMKVDANTLACGHRAANTFVGPVAMVTKWSLCTLTDVSNAS